MREILFIFLLLFSLAGVQVQAQRANKPDSLLQLLSTAKKDSSRVNILLALADHYERYKQDSASYYLQEAKLLATSLDYTMGVFKYYRQAAIVSYIKGKYTKAMEESIRALSLARQLKDSTLVVSMLNNTAIVFGYLGKFEEQLNYLLQAKNAVEAIRDSTKFTNVYHNLANCYNNLKQYRRAIANALLAVNMHTVYNKRNVYINRVYATLAQNYEALQVVDSALYYYDISIKESVQSNDKYAEATIYGYLSNLYANHHQFAEMLRASEKSLVLARALQSRQMLSGALDNTAYASMFNGNNERAIKDIREALDIATKDSLVTELKDSYLALSYIAVRTGDFATSVSARQKTDSIQQAIFNEQIISSTMELEKKYETEKKDKQIKLQQAQLQQRRTFNYILVGSAAVLLIISILFYRNYAQKRKLQEQRIRELEKEKQLMATESVLKGEEKERTRLAKDLHDGLGGCCLVSNIHFKL